MHQKESDSMSTDLPSSRRHLRPLATSAIACTLLAAAVAHAQPIFKSVDSTGRVTYSQEPIPGAVSVDKVDVTPKVVVDRPAGAGSAAAPMTGGTYPAAGLTIGQAMTFGYVAALDACAKSLETRAAE